METKSRLESACYHVKKALIETLNESWDKGDPFVPSEFDSFPRGACEVTSLWLGKMLMEIGFQDIHVCNGSHRKPTGGSANNHVWLFVNSKFYVDITGNQFKECGQEIVVSNEIPKYLSNYFPFTKTPLEKYLAVCLTDNNYVELEAAFRTTLEQP
ncbi:hypothetical protein [Enterovibrio norvegicus]|uniref:hypothetical protein n=1 Tax=Enterovibrio norvegicus TaxID=188144 RepID=UPI000C84A5FF|nr:hypothetical protein [Enterovibrio norvegicus]PMN67075.1 hypothetical protein BCT27_24310 [Enterovibrio norvegicus]